ncbi:MerR family transcriptional regulator [Moheibacter sediminis]|uniref:DNA-binding transcriptional regulator, MerR family n=1 Tax=Moheibacter sediminis TaxID=1434700 RepID=A0A1W2CB04_9FLAO|nr:MerR family transcriptional regulator [Moheibacter sediminis]SMC82276.1 DNA-binding transcriptional regulator, MerR family [Moheibacter sediminis]
MQIELPEKLYYSIGEVAKAFNVNTSLIRFWEKEFEVISPKKNKKGNRYFTPQDIKNLKLIYHLVKERGYTLEGAKSALTEKEDIKEEVELLARMEFIRAELVKLKESFDVAED